MFIERIFIISFFPVRKTNPYPGRVTADNRKEIIPVCLMSGVAAIGALIIIKRTTDKKRQETLEVRLKSEKHEDQNSLLRNHSYIIFQLDWKSTNE